MKLLSSNTEMKWKKIEYQYTILLAGYQFFFVLFFLIDLSSIIFQTPKAEFETTDWHWMLLTPLVCFSTQLGRYTTTHCH